MVDRMDRYGEHRPYAERVREFDLRVAVQDQFDPAHFLVILISLKTERWPCSPR